jgi:hypothetical protein
VVGEAAGDDGSALVDKSIGVKDEVARWEGCRRAKLSK